jgi:hypothetical protein
MKRKHVRFKRALGVIVGTVAVSASTLIAGTSPAQAAGESHYIYIHTDGSAGRWISSGTLSDGRGRDVYNWYERHNGNSQQYALWYFRGSYGSVSVRIEDLRGYLSSSNLSLSKNHCFFVSASGISQTACQQS